MTKYNLYIPASRQNASEPKFLTFSSRTTSKIQKWNNTLLLTQKTKTTKMK